MFYSQRCAVVWTYNGKELFYSQRCAVVWMYNGKELFSPRCAVVWTYNGKELFYSQRCAVVWTYSGKEVRGRWDACHSSLMKKEPHPSRMKGFLRADSVARDKNFTFRTARQRRSWACFFVPPRPRKLATPGRN